MTTTKHTPGPWHHNVSPRFPIYSGDSPATIVHVAQVLTRRIGEGEVRANMRLIVAAPDLLAAAKDALESLRRLPDQSHPPAYRVTCMAQLERAIAKAEGAEGAEGR